MHSDCRGHACVLMLILRSEVPLTDRRKCRLQVMVEGPNPRDSAQATGRTRHNKPVFFDADGAALKGQLVTVRVDKVHAYTLYGSKV